MKPRVLVCILSFNDFAEVKRCLDSVLLQEFDGHFEVLIIDSSTNEKERAKVEGLAEAGRVEVHLIDNHNFCHGTTRQEAVDIAISRDFDFISFIVQDAVTVNDLWLRSMLDGFALGDDVALVFGKHIPYESHNPLAKSWVSTTFYNISPDDSIRVHRAGDAEVGRDFNSNVNASYRLEHFKTTLRFPNIHYSEDQYIAKQILSCNLLKVYNPQAAVYHSHNLWKPLDQFQRLFDEYSGLKDSIGVVPETVTFLGISAKVRKDFITNKGFIDSDKSLNVLSKWYWKRQAYWMSLVKYLALYFCLNRDNIENDEVLTYLSRDEMKKSLMINRLNFFQRIRLRIIMLSLIFRFGKRGFYKGLNENEAEQVVLNEARVTKHVVTEHLASNVVTSNGEFDQLNARTKNFHGLPPYYRYIGYYDPESLFEPQPVTIKIASWVIPDFGIGAGGHRTIFRYARYLEDYYGYFNKFYVLPPTQWKSDKEIKEAVVKHYVDLNKYSIEVVDPDATTVDDCGILFATSWETAYFIHPVRNCQEKVYFIQDYEPWFFSRGAEYMLAEYTYKFGYKAICASSWLNSKMLSMDTESTYFELGVDTSIYTILGELEREPNSVAIYARRYSPRRAVDFVLTSIIEYSMTNPDVKVYLFGDNELKIDRPNFYNLGVLDEIGLARLYNKCSVGVALSSTNYSLIPQEMNACGLPVIELDWEGNQVNYSGRDYVYLVPIVSRLFGEKLNDLLSMKTLPCDVSETVSTISWTDCFRRTESFLSELHGGAILHKVYE